MSNDIHNEGLMQIDDSSNFSFEERKRRRGTESLDLVTSTSSGIFLAGRSGGLCMLWKTSASCKLIGYPRNHIDMHIIDEKDDWRLTGYYGFPERRRRRDSWNLLRRLSSLNSLPWCIMGDFNDLLDPGDKRGRIDHPNWLMQGFREAIIECGLSDIPLRGYQYTWSRGLGTSHFVEERLDRGMATSNWKNLFPEAVLLPITVAMSDHVPLLLNCRGAATPRITRRFRFENKWCFEPDFPNVIPRKGGGRINLSRISLSTKGEPMLSPSRSLRKQGKSCPTSFSGKKLIGNNAPNNTGCVREIPIQNMASARRKVNTITKLRRDDGSWASSTEEIGQEARQYFENLFDDSTNNVDFYQVLNRLTPCVDNTMNAELTKSFQFEEFSSAVAQMHPDKSPGPDGFNPKFYQKFWNVVGEDVYRSCCDWLTTGTFPPTLNNTLVTLIPKVDSPTNMKELRPIALCNVVYKIISKVLCNRLKKVLPCLIDRSQSAFVEGRMIQDNILIAFEAIHSMKRKTRGKNGYLALKIDISKAYDRVDWNYLDAVLQRLGFCDKWLEWMRLCVRTVSYEILINSAAVSPIIPGRGLRQGDPLSPYLFILCAEGLSAMINYETARGDIHGIQMGRRGPAVSHLMFADDCIFFCRASELECANLKRVLGIYELASGQAINYQKSGVFFSLNVSATEREAISGTLGVTSALDTGRYLGLPSLIGRKKKEIFKYLRDRLWKKIQGWNGKKLSKAGKEILLKGVAQAIPSYCMSIFLLPTSLTDEMEKLMNSFWWSNKGGAGRSINWMKWDKMCVDKKFGGMGFRSMQLFNIAMLGKTGWRLIEEPDALVCRILKAKYFPNDDFLRAKVGSSPSFTWRSICAAQDLVRSGTRWRVGDGTGIKVYEDPWLRRDGRFHVSSHCPPNLSGLTVHDIFIPGARSWNVDFMETILNEEDVQEISRTPIVPTSNPDKLIWHYSPTGRYTVKSAYRLASSLTLDPTYSIEGHWSLLWKIKVPQKVQNILWRAARDNLPSKAKLLSRGLQVGGECGICKAGYENLWHTFFSCPFAEDCWRISNMELYIDNVRSRCESFLQALFMIVDDKDDTRKIKICMLLWQIWKARNSAVWNNENPSPASSVLMAACTYEDWTAAHSRARPGPVAASSGATCVGWHGLPSGWFCCNVDAAFFRESNTCGLGMAIRDHNGNFIAGKSIKIVGSWSVEEGEMMGIKEALSWLKEKELTHGRVETDSKRACDAINSRAKNFSEMGALASHCRNELSLAPDVRIHHVKRTRNAIAHILAKAARDIDAHHVWNEPPSFVVGHLHIPCSCD
ncbi:uncharacterized protein LOC131012797 [Salvia miltiorrhiza]|uniref:uncharacterized protein LOC131012797 n=1 Tax=Salvia miltiorrhiza TaxID=226208 RepID=UPI0025ABE349|nr:uncharacterized protein LOC131012797 [Salvia miltiorrhiza]